MNLTRRQKILIGGGVVGVAAVVVVLYFVFVKDTPKTTPTSPPTSPPTPPAKSKCDMCNDRLYEWMVTNKWFFEDTRNNWKDICGDCETVWFKIDKEPQSPQIVKPYTSKDGTNWKQHKDHVSAYEDVKCRCTSATTNPPTNTPPPRCDVDKCNQIMKEWIDGNYEFDDTAKIWPSCANCPSRWYKWPNGISLNGVDWEPMPAAVYDENLNEYVANPELYNKLKLPSSQA